MAAQRNLGVIRAMVADGHEICSHGYRWIDYQYMDEAQEREHARSHPHPHRTHRSAAVGDTDAPARNTRRLVMEEGGFYDSDTYETTTCLYWDPASTAEEPHLVIPYTLDTNDMRFTPVGASAMASSSLST